MPNRKIRRHEKALKKRLEKESPTLRFQFKPGFLLSHGPIIETDIGVTDTFAAALKSEGRPVPNTVRCRLLLDTGADLCLLRHDFALKAGLKLISAESPIQGVGIDTTGRSYLGRLWFGIPSKKVPDSLHQVWIETEIVGASLPYEHVDGLIGRDILQYFDLRYNGHTGAIIMRVPRGKDKQERLTTLENENWASDESIPVDSLLDCEIFFTINDRGGATNIILYAASRS